MLTIVKQSYRDLAIKSQNNKRETEREIKHTNTYIHRMKQRKSLRKSRMRISTNRIANSCVHKQMWVMCFINKANESTCMLDFGSQYGYLCLDWCLSTLRLPLHVSFYHSIDLARFYFLFFALVSSSVYRRSFSVSLLFISISVSENVMCASQKRLLPAYLHSFAHAHEILTKSETVLLRLVHCSLLIAHWLRTFNTRCSQSPYIWGKLNNGIYFNGKTVQTIYGKHPFSTSVYLLKSFCNI